MKYSLIAGRILFALIFFISAPGHFNEQTIAFAAAKGVPMASVLVPFSGILEFAGGLSILLGFRARLGAWLLVLFLLPVTFMLHQFWIVADPLARHMEFSVFLKNIALTGSALMITYLGSGEWSLDKYLERKRLNPSAA